jgi:hypothetical protein
MHNFFAKFVKILDLCKSFSKDLVNEKGNLPRCGVVPRFSDHEVIVLSLTAMTESIDSENRLLVMLKGLASDMPNLISRRQYNDCRKLAAGLCEEIRKRMASDMDGVEDYFCIVSKPVGLPPLPRQTLQDGQGHPGDCPELRLLRVAGSPLFRIQVARPVRFERRNTLV